MSKGRPSEDTELAMYQTILRSLANKGLIQYEISNFAKQGYKSKHNENYWRDGEFWGLGVGAYSYSKNSEYGLRFWNPSNLDSYLKQSSTSKKFDAIEDYLDSRQFEKLEINEALTDFLYTHLRCSEGFSKKTLCNIFGPKALFLVEKRIDNEIHPEFIQNLGDQVILTSKGFELSNQVFRGLTFLSSDLKSLAN